jgi:hypothetical protein
VTDWVACPDCGKTVPWHKAKDGVAAHHAKGTKQWCSASHTLPNAETPTGICTECGQRFDPDTHRNRPTDPPVQRRWGGKRYLCCSSQCTAQRTFRLDRERYERNKAEHAAAIAARVAVDQAWMDKELSP